MYEETKALYPTENQLMISNLGICGCVPDDLYKVFHKYLKGFSENIYYDKIEPNDTELVRYLVLIHLDKIELIEHGTAIRGSWLTEKGKKTLEALNQFEKIDYDTCKIYKDIESNYWWERKEMETRQ
jgi:hypothetical protein